MGTEVGNTFISFCLVGGICRKYLRKVNCIKKHVKFLSCSFVGSRVQGQYKLGFDVDLTVDVGLGFKETLTWLNRKSDQDWDPPVCKDVLLPDPSS